MPATPMRRLIACLSLPLYVIDQLTKNWIVANFPLGGHGQVIIDQFFTVHHIANTGIAFGNFNGGQHSNVIFGVVALIAMSLIWRAQAKGLFPGTGAKVAVSLLVAGVAGNLTDRFLHGYVVDFLSFDLHVPFANPWPSFNVADACVVVAAGLLAIASFKAESATPTKPTA